MNVSAAIRSRLIPTLALVLALGAAAVIARADSGPPAPPAPPANTCNGQQAGASCTITFGDRTIRGSCASAPDGRLACRPSAPAPPAEAVTACNARRVGDACSVTFGPVSVSGSCATADDGSLACRPAPQR